MNKDFLNRKGLLLIDFYAEWCGPCKMLKLVLDDISKEIKNIEIYKFNVEEDKHKFAKKMGVMNIPTLILLKDGIEIKRHIGFINKEDLIDFLNE